MSSACDDAHHPAVSAGTPTKASIVACCHVVPPRAALPRVPRHSRQLPEPIRPLRTIEGARTMALVQVRTPDREGTQPGLTAAAAETSGTTPRWQVVAASFAAIIAVWLLSIAINASFKPTALVIPAGISLFAMLYAVTQGLERLLEPVSSFFFSTTQHTENRNATLAAAVNLQTATDGELPTKLSELAK